jgi:hypothetical protein
MTGEAVSGDSRRLSRPVASGTGWKRRSAIPTSPLSDFFIGVGSEHHGRFADLVSPPPEEAASWGAPDPESMVGKALGNPDVGGASVANSAPWRCAQLPGTNGHGDARTVARIYAALANGGSIDGVRLMSNETVEQATLEQVSGVDCVMQLEEEWHWVTPCRADFSRQRRARAHLDTLDSADTWLLATQMPALDSPMSPIR